MAKGTAPVKYIVGILTRDEGIRDHVVDNLVDYFGPADYLGKWYPFIHTNFYSAEMGVNLKRSFISFERLMAPELLYKAKYWCNKVEERFKKDGKRTVNLDPGYVDYFKLVLASGKFGNHRIALAKGCWADFIMMYSKGKWQALPWCFPDFLEGVYDNDLMEIRRLFKSARQKMGC